MNGQWGVICANSNSYRENNTQVVCRQLGYNSGKLQLTLFIIAKPVTYLSVIYLHTPGAIFSYFLPGTGPFVRSNVRCMGKEQKLVDCMYTTVPRTYHCSHSRDFAVSCQDQCSVHGDLRLADGYSPNEGRVEICINEHWRTVCDNLENEVVPLVVCRQLGYYGKFSISNDLLLFMSQLNPIL